MGVKFEYLTNILIQPNKKRRHPLGKKKFVSNMALVFIEFHHLDIKLLFKTTHSKH